MIMKVKTAIFIIIIVGLMMPAFSYSKEDRPIKYVRGRIYGIDYAGSKITIQWFYSTGKIAEDKITFFIPNNVSVLTDKRKIFKNFRRAGVVDLIKGDHVIIKYYDDKKKGNLEAISIRVLEHDRPIPY